MRLIDADKLSFTTVTTYDHSVGSKTLDVVLKEDIDNAPTVLHDNYSMGYQDGVKKVLSERPQGKWIMKNDYTFDCNLCGCSCLDKNNYCPDCGADMRGGREC